MSATRAGTPYAWHLVIMARFPVAGRAKTRLAREVGMGTALRFARHTSAAVMQRLASDPRWRVTIAVTPDSGVAASEFPPHIARCRQGRGDIGQRMQRLLDGFPAGPVVIVGTDIPAITPRAVAVAFRRLGAADAVFGPADDGGFWLVGASRRRRSQPLFRRVRWSTCHALADTLAGLHGASVAFADTLSDVDSAADLARSGSGFGRRVRSIGPPLRQS
jgi:rSAM/selenodomain-associated transferase 1